MVRIAPLPVLRQEDIDDVLAFCELVGFTPTFLCKSIYAGIEAWNGSRRITYANVITSGLAVTDDITGLTGDWVNHCGEWWMRI